MKTQTKTEIRNNTAKATKLLRGIDNETAAIAKGTEALNKRTEKVVKDVATVTALFLGMSNTATAAVSAKPVPAPKPAAKPAAKTAAKPAAKTAPKPAKPAKTPKPALAAKTAKKPAAKAAPKPTKKVAAKTAPKAKPVKAAKPVAAGERPKLKTVLNALMDAATAANGGKPSPLTRPVLYKQVCDQHGYYSRQSLYNALDDTKSYTKVSVKIDDKSEDAYIRAPGAATSGTSDEEAAAFVEKVDGAPAVSAVS